MNRTATALIALAAFATAPSALAGSKVSKNLNACADLVRAELPIDASDVNVDFKSVKGTSRLQTLTLKVQAEDVKGRVTCKVRRNTSPELVWDDTLEAFRVELAARKTEKAPANQA